jgi:hypothetical protein
MQLPQNTFRVVDLQEYVTHKHTLTGDHERGTVLQTKRHMSTKQCVRGESGVVKPPR